MIPKQQCVIIESENNFVMHDGRGKMPKQKQRDKDASSEAMHKKDTGGSKKESKKKQNKENTVVSYFRNAIAETKRVTYPDKVELFKWSVIVLVTIAVFSVLIYVTDTLIATPLNYAISSVQVGDSDLGPLNIATIVVFFLSGILTMIGIFLHQGEQGGLSDGLASRLTGGSGMAQKNLDRLTIICALIFVATFIVFMISLPQGTIVTQ